MLLSQGHSFNWSTDAEARAEMVRFIREKFSDVLGDDIKYLDLPNGLELLQERIKIRLAAQGVVTEQKQAAA